MIIIPITYNKREIYRYYYILTICFLSLFLLSCNKDDIPDFGQISNSEQITLYKIKYGKDELQSMDIHLPANRNQQSTKVIILIHGGGWFRGNKEEMTVFVEELKNQMDNNYAIVNINYRLVNPLGPRYMLPTQTDDIGSVIDYVEKHSATLGVKPQFVTMGISAGAHLAMLYSYKYDTKRRVKAVVNIVGPSDLTDPFYTNEPLFGLGMRLIANKKDVPAEYSAMEFASPITWITKDSQATISFYGETDHLVPIVQQDKLKKRLDQLAVINKQYDYSSGHLFYEKIEGAVEDIVLKTKEFLESN